MPGSRISLVTRGANPLATYPFPSVKSCDLREVAHGDRRVSSAGSLHPEDVSLIGTTAGMASVAVQFDPERHLSSFSSYPVLGPTDCRISRFLVALPRVPDLSVRAEDLFKRAKDLL